MLIECDPSIKSIIVNIDSENHDFIIEDLDEERVVVKENMVPLLKQKLEDVRITTLTSIASPVTWIANLACSASRKTCRQLMNLAPRHEAHSMYTTQKLAWPASMGGTGVIGSDLDFGIHSIPSFFYFNIQNHCHDPHLYT